MSAITIFPSASKNCTIHDIINKVLNYKRSLSSVNTINNRFDEEINNEYKEIWYKINKYVDFSSKIILKNI